MRLNRFAELMNDAPTGAVIQQFIDVVVHGEDLSEQNPNALFELSAWLDDVVNAGVLDSDDLRGKIAEHLAGLELRGWKYGR